MYQMSRLAKITATSHDEHQGANPFNGNRYMLIIEPGFTKKQVLPLVTASMVDSGICTCCDKNYFSFRRDGSKAGRMISIMMLRGHI